MRVAWLAAGRDFDHPGGAELADADMLSQRPEHLEVDVAMSWPEDEALETYDRVVVTSLRGLNAQQIGQLAFLSPVMWVHDTEFSGHWVYAKANPLITLTPTHREFEMAANERLQNVLVNPGWMDLDVLPPTVDADSKQPFALWAHRPVEHKGLDLAKQWSEEESVPLQVMVERPREEVLEAMQVAEYFILLSRIFDPGPRSIMEAQLMGCKIIVDNVGFFEGVDELRDEIQTSAEAFWDVVCG